MSTELPSVPSSLAVTTSGRPSALTSTATTDRGTSPAANTTGAANVGVAAPDAVVLIRTETALPSASGGPALALIRSSLPSPSTSAAARDHAVLIAPKGVGAAKLGVAAPAAVVLRSTSSAGVPLEFELLTTRSGLASPVTSATARENGKAPASNGVGPLKVGGAAAAGAAEAKTISALSTAT